MRTWRINHLLLLSLIMTATPGFCTAEEPQPIEWVETYKEAREQGIEQQRPVLLFVTTEHCVHCDKMLDNVFTDARVVDEIHSSFVPAKLKLTPAGRLAHELKVTIYPTTVMISPNGKILDYVRGALTTSDLRNRMTVAVAAEHRLASAE